MMDGEGISRYPDGVKRLAACRTTTIRESNEGSAWRTCCYSFVIRPSFLLYPRYAILISYTVVKRALAQYSLGLA